MSESLAFFSPTGLGSYFPYMHEESLCPRGNCTYAHIWINKDMKDGQLGHVGNNNMTRIMGKKKKNLRLITRGLMNGAWINPPPLQLFIIC